SQIPSGCRVTPGTGISRHIGRVLSDPRGDATGWRPTNPHLVEDPVNLGQKIAVPADLDQRSLDPSRLGYRLVDERQLSFSEHERGLPVNHVLDRVTVTVDVVVGHNDDY